MCVPASAQRSFASTQHARRNGLTANGLHPSDRLFQGSRSLTWFGEVQVVIDPAKFAFGRASHRQLHLFSRRTLRQGKYAKYLYVLRWGGQTLVAKSEACGQTARNLCSCSGESGRRVRTFSDRAKFYAALQVATNLDSALQVGIERSRSPAVR
jgi:hypothetical protein